jgi:glycerol uptake facilitator-like aquaporin
MLVEFVGTCVLVFVAVSTGGSPVAIGSTVFTLLLLGSGKYNPALLLSVWLRSPSPDHQHLLCLLLSELLGAWLGTVLLGLL